MFSAWSHQSGAANIPVAVAARSSDGTLTRAVVGFFFSQLRVRWHDRANVLVHMLDG